MPRKSRPWFRFYVEACHDRKLRRLKPEYRWLFVACLAAARASCEPGWLLVGANDPMTVDDLMDFAAMERKAVVAGMAVLIEAGVVGFECDMWFIPNWDDRQFETDDVTARVQRSRARRSNVSTSSVATPPETEADTENRDTDPLRGSTGHSIAAPQPVDDMATALRSLKRVPLGETA